MKTLKIPPVQDIARIVCPTVGETVQRLVSYYDGAGIFNYSCAGKLSRFAFARIGSIEQLLAACQNEKTDVGRKQNSEVIQLIWRSNEGRKITAHELKPKIFSIRKDLYIRVSPAFYFVENRQPTVLWLQPRKTFSLTEQQLGLLASLVRMAYLVDDFEGVRFEILDLSAVDGIERSVRTFSLESLPLLPDGMVETLLQRFAKAYDVVKETGITPRERPSKSPPKEPDFFL